MKRILIALALASLLVPASANLIANGGFEDGVAYPFGLTADGGVPGPWYMTSWHPDTHDKTGVDGWDDETGIFDTGVGDGIFRDMPTPFGNRFVGIAAFSFGVESFSQDVSGLVEGEEYILSAWMQTDARGNGSSAGGPYSGLGEIIVLFNSAPIGTLTSNSASGVWEARSFTFQATATSGTFTFVASYDPNTLESAFMGIDEISLNVVPEPATVVALGTGLVALARRRRKA